MGNKKLHPVRFSEAQVEFIEGMATYWGEDWENKDILSTIKKSVGKDKKVLNVKKSWIPPFIPPNQEKAKKCYHLNIKFNYHWHSQVCPDCHTVVWPSDMINIILDAISSHIFHYNRSPGLM